MQHSLSEGFRAQNGTVTVKRDGGKRMLLMVVVMMMMQEERGR